MTNFLKDSLLYLYAAALFLSAALLFLVQPMVAKMILPFLGGSSAVWITCLFFFQSFLLLGYLYAHFASSWLGVRKHRVVHLAIVAFALFFLPITLPVGWLARPESNPIYLVLGVLFVSVGFPFFVLSASAPLLQKWFSMTGHADAQDPYFLYVASNAGSLVGLLAYPFLLEPHLNLSQQAWFWLYVYLGFFVLALFCGLALRGLASRAKDQTPAREAFASNIDSTTEKLSLLRRFRWVALSFVPSSLLLGVTTYITTDLASVPLLWVLPLSLYLVSFIVGFQRDSWGSHPFVVRRQSFLLLGAAITFFANATEPAIILLPLHLLSFFATALVCHAELAKDRPQTQHLTEYYLWISFGGVLGGFFNGFLAPLIFNTVAEYPLAMIGAALVRPPLDQNFRKPATYWLDFIWPATLFIIILGLVLWVEKGDLFSAKIAHVLIFGVSGVIGLSFAPRPVRYALGIGAIMLATSQYHGPFGQVLFTKRSFFGVYRAMQGNERNYHYIFHGTTLHGAQSLDPKRRLVPISYYYSTGPAGQVFRALSENGFDKPVAIVGLGAGALACYGKPGQIFTFYEIDPLVERIARDPDLFTYLKDCSPQTSVRIGDARLTLASAPGHYYGMFILDAFSGDSIPIHLLTREAVELYLSKLVPEGVLLFNISNRYMNLAPVIDRVATELKLTAFLRDDLEINEIEQAEGKQPSSWVVLARQNKVLAAFDKDPKWKPLVGKLKSDLWTDNYSNILQALRWQ